MTSSRHSKSPFGSRSQFEIYALLVGSGAILLFLICLRVSHEKLLAGARATTVTQRVVATKSKPARPVAHRKTPQVMAKASDTEESEPMVAQSETESEETVATVGPTPSRADWDEKWVQEAEGVHASVSQVSKPPASKADEFIFEFPTLFKHPATPHNSSTGKPLAAPSIEASTEDDTIETKQISRLVDQAVELQAEITDLVLQGDRLRDEQVRLEEQSDRLAQQLEKLAPQSVPLGVSPEHKKLVALMAEVGSLRAQLDHLDLQIQQAQGQSTPIDNKEIRHRIAMVNHATGPTLHFRLAENGVSELPFKALTALLKVDLTTQREQLQKSTLLDGDTSPLNGYRLHYSCERMDRGAAKIRTGLTTLPLKTTALFIPQADLITESAEEAFTLGSQFLTALTQGETKSKLVFWVYPDSFELHQELKAYAQSHGHEVISRPLPADVPISVTTK